MKLNLGCGQQLLDGFLNTDIAALPGVDLVADLNHSLPFRDDCVDEVRMDSVLEHLDDVGTALREVHRVLKPGGTVKVGVPHAYSLDAFRDPTHKHFFVSGTFEFFVEGNPRHYYYGFAFRAAKGRIIFSQRSLLHRWLERAANRRPWLYENTFLRMFPCLGLEVEMVK